MRSFPQSIIQKTLPISHSRFLTPNLSFKNHFPFLFSVSICMSLLSMLEIEDGDIHPVHTFTSVSKVIPVHIMFSSYKKVGGLKKRRHFDHNFKKANCVYPNFTQTFTYDLPHFLYTLGSNQRS